MVNIIDDTQFQQILVAMTTEINPNIPQANFIRTSGQESITDLIGYYSSTEVKLWQEDSQ